MAASRAAAASALSSGSATSRTPRIASSESSLGGATLAISAARREMSRTWLQRGFVEADFGLAADALDGEANLDIAALKALGAGLAHARLQGVVAGRQARF